MSEWSYRVIFAPVTTIGGKQTAPGVQLVMRRMAPDGQWQYREPTQAEHDDYADRAER